MTPIQKLEKIKEWCEMQHHWKNGKKIVNIDDILEIITVQQSTPSRLPFSYNLFLTGKYRVETRDGRKVEQLHKFEGMDACFLGVVNNSYLSWYENGTYSKLEESDKDLFLIEIKPEPVVEYRNVYKKDGIEFGAWKTIEACERRSNKDAINITKFSIYPDGTIETEIVKTY